MRATRSLRWCWCVIELSGIRSGQFGGDDGAGEFLTAGEVVTIEVGDDRSGDRHHASDESEEDGI